MVVIVLCCASFGFELMPLLWSCMGQMVVDVSFDGQVLPVTLTLTTTVL